MQPNKPHHGTSVNHKTPVESFYHRPTGSFTHVVIDNATSSALIVDPVADFDLSSGKLAYTSAEAVVDFMVRRKARLEWIVETHIHADHVTAAPYLRSLLGGRYAAGLGVTAVESAFADLIFDQEEPAMGAFDRLLREGDQLSLGESTWRILETPGHTPSCITLLGEGLAFSGDTILSPSLGTARCDFPGGSPEILHDSISRLLALPDDTLLMLAHDYPEGTSEAVSGWHVTDQRSTNIHLAKNMTRDAFVALRRARDLTLPLPRLFYASLQLNLCGGRLPRADQNGRRFIRIPLSRLSGPFSP